MRILRNPWKETLLDLSAEAESSIWISSPFVKRNICDELLKAKKKNVHLELITSFNLSNIHHGSLDISGLDLILKNRGVIKSHYNLHAKTYIFDREKAVITSGNLTNGGLVKNYEYGILLENIATVKEIVRDFKNLSSSSTTRRIQEQHLEDARNILAKIPKPNKGKIPRLIDSPETSDILGDIAPQIESSLIGWKREVFKCLDSLPQQQFSLENAYQFEKKLSAVYPQNLNIKAKIRQQLQYLRDLGLIEFLGDSMYLKKWT